MPATFPDRLREDGDYISLPRSGWLIAVLFLLCLVPRCLLAWKLRSVCDDGYYYIFVANSLRDGDFTDAFEYLNLNLYPAILLLLNKLGFDWVVAGKLWGTLISSLVVLPLFGWVRRLFDDRVAVLACFLYSVHPQLIELGVEPIREATFWFLFTLCLYLIWRAVAESHLRMFALAGLVLALAVHTRVEGWVLLVPLVWWSLHRWRNVATTRKRPRLLIGGLSCVAITPLLLLAVNLTLLRQHSHWELGRLGQFAMVTNWLKLTHSTNDHATYIDPRSLTAASPASIQPSLSTQSPPQAVADVPDASIPSPAAELNAHPISEAPPRLGILARAAIYFKDISRSLGPVFLVLAIVGLWNWRALLVQRDKSALAIVGALLLLAVWIRLERVGNINSRYFLVSIFVMIPFEALGCLDAIGWISRFEGWRTWYRQPRMAAAIGLLSALLLAGWIGGLRARHKERDAQLALGEYLRASATPNISIVADLGAARASYPITGELPLLIWPQELFMQVFHEHPPDMAIFSRDYLPLEHQPAFVEHARALGLELVDPVTLPATQTPFVVFKQCRPKNQVAETPLDGETVIR